MDLTASCKNESCVAFGREKPVTLEEMLGCNVAGVRVRCHACGSVVTTNKPAKPSGKSRVDMIRRRVASKPKPTRKLN
jgi:hypothetical protein